MRLTIVLVIIGCLHAGAKGVSQTITLHRIDSPLETVLNDIHRQSGYSFVYNLEWLARVPKVTLTVEQATLTETLDQLLAGQPLSYTLIDKTVVLRWQPKPPPVLVQAPEAPSVGAGEGVTLFVRNNQGQALAGASVYLKKGHRGMITGANGQFTLSNLTGEDTLVVSYVGYKTRNVSLTNLVQTTFPVILMVESDDKLDQMVVQAYGTTSQRLSTGSITRVSGEEIAKQPISNPILALQGRVAGLSVQATSSYGSGPVKLEIRGRGTINPQFTSEPLIIIDGVQMNSLDADPLSSYQSGSLGLVQNGFITPANGQSPFYGLSASDIESISVLKDASATAIYGSRGGNGVILITTKRGQAGVDGKTAFTVGITEGFSRPTGRWKLLGTKDYLAMRREAYANDGRTPTLFDAPDLLLWDTTRNTDWQEEIYGGRKAKYLNAHAALSGGDARTQFYLSGAYNRQSALLLLSTPDQSVNLGFTLNHSSLNNKFKISWGASYLYNAIKNQYMPDATLLAPDAPPIFDKYGELNWGPWDSAGIGSSNPFASFKNVYEANTNALNSTLKMKYEIFRGLIAEVAFGFRSSRMKQYKPFPGSSMDPVSNSMSYVMFGDNTGSQYSIEPDISYSRYLGPGELTVIAGASYQRQVSDGIG
jgi:TonB-dependent SusC/RagA subfamily outer membrane receptor